MGNAEPGPCYELSWRDILKTSLDFSCSGVSKLSIDMGGRKGCGVIREISHSFAPRHIACESEQKVLETAASGHSTWQKASSNVEYVTELREALILYRNVRTTRVDALEELEKPTGGQQACYTVTIEPKTAPNYHPVAQSEVANDIGRNHESVRRQVIAAYDPGRTCRSAPTLVLYA
jgi:hypothetical protein